MSRSRKKTPIVPMTTSKSEKMDKRKANRKLRSKFNRLILKTIEPDEIPYSLSDVRSVSNIWTFSKDGKQYFDKPEGWRK